MNSARPLALLLVFVSGASLAAESGAGAVERLLDDNFAGYSERGEPGVAAMVIENGAIRLQRTYGVADIQRRNPITPDTAFRLASVSKQFAAMAVMILAEDGKLDYDDPVSRFVPALAPYEGVTVRNLLQHTGGLPDYYDVIDTSKGMPTNEDAARLLGELASWRARSFRRATVMPTATRATTCWGRWWKPPRASPSYYSSRSGFSMPPA